MRLHTLPVLVLPLAFAPAAIAQSVYVQPAGYESVEGNSSSGIPFSYVSARVQQADANRIGTVMASINRLSFRRDRSAGTTATARTIDVTASMGKADINLFSATFANNWLSPPTTVYTTKPTSLPDISVSPGNPPGPFVIPIVLDAPFFYDGVDSLMWELQVDNGVTGTYSMDWVSAATTTAGGTTTALGIGCTTANGTMSHTTSFSATATALNLSFAGTAAPSNTPVILLLGVLDPNLNVPGLCTALHSDVLFSQTLGTSGATGTLASTTLPLSFVPGTGGIPLYTQLAAVDLTQPGIPVALSNGRMSPLPLTPGGPAPTGIKRTYSLTSSSAVTGSTPSVSAVVTQIDY